MSEEMVDAGRKVDVGFIVNVVTDASGKVCDVVAGDMEGLAAWSGAVPRDRRHAHRQTV